MKWIQHDKGKVTRGEVATPSGDLFFVDEQGSRAIINGVLYVNGKQSIKGVYKVTMKDGSAVEFDVPMKGAKAARTDTKVERGGAKLA